MNIFLSTLLLSLVPYIFADKPKLSDRLVLEINRSSYTQRQFEAYIVLQSVLTSGPSQRLTLVGPDNWTPLLLDFKDAMVIEQEAMRLSSLQPAIDIIESYHQIVEGRKETDLIFSGFLLRYGIDHDEIRQILSSISRVEAYKKGRQGTSVNESSKIEELSQAEWFKKISSRTSFRIYKSAETFQEITPVVGPKLDFGS